jgi:hypothetical protein
MAACGTAATSSTIAATAAWQKWAGMDRVEPVTAALFPSTFWGRHIRSQIGVLTRNFRWLVGFALPAKAIIRRQGHAISRDFSQRHRFIPCTGKLDADNTTFCCGRQRFCFLYFERKRTLFACTRSPEVRQSLRVIDRGPGNIAAKDNEQYSFNEARLHRSTTKDFENSLKFSVNAEQSIRKCRPIIPRA